MEGTPYDDRVGVHEGRYPETALAKAAVWYDGYQQEQVAKLARAIENVAVPKGTEERPLEHACVVAVEGRAPFLAHVARVLDEVIPKDRLQ